MEGRFAILSSAEIEQLVADKDSENKKIKLLFILDYAGPEVDIINRAHFIETNKSSKQR